MYRRVGIWLICVAAASAVPAGAQAPASPSLQPVATADSEPWYLSGEPLTYEGNFYYPVGALTAFNRNEMVRTGFYRGMPLYARTTIEPWSAVYVPVSGGFMQPYVRRRSGEIAGTIGSIAPGLPIERDDTSRALTGAPLMAPGPPTNLPDTPVGRRTQAAPAETATVGTTGRFEQGATAATPSMRGANAVAILPPSRSPITAARPTGVDGVYVMFDAERWYSSGSSLELDSSFRHVGDYHGIPVYVRDRDRTTIYIPVTTSTPGLVAPYSKRR